MEIVFCCLKSYHLGQKREKVISTELLIEFLNGILLEVQLKNNDKQYLERGGKKKKEKAISHGLKARYYAGGLAIWSRRVADDSC